MHAYMHGLAQAPPVARVCDDRRLPVTGAITPFTANRVACPATVFGQPDPVGVIRAAIARAVEMLDNTIGELVRGRTRVCQGDPPAWPLLGDVTLCWLRHALSINIDDIRVWTAGTFVNRSVAEVIRRLVRVRNLIASNAIRYICGGTCNPGDPPVCAGGVWAFICRPDPCPPGAIPAVIHLCRDFWVRKPRVTAAVHAEFQAQTIIHEASHLYHCTSDARGSTIGVAECLSQFVAATNGSPIDRDFSRRCVGAARCLAAGGEVAGFGAAPSGRVVVVKTVFRPETAVRLKGRRAVRR